jgi:ABC-type iron transport system FetAB ATPase subunit/GNAT superfamily N-acetyltransferase
MTQNEFIHLSVEVERSARVRQIEGMFDLDADRQSSTQIRRLDRDALNEHPWNVGLIVGPSGAGKSTVAEEAFTDLIVDFEWSKNRALVDDFPTTVKVTSNLLTSVGLSSPPVWVRPFHTLSTGEQFRAGLARALAASEDEPIVIDEFTSVVDRVVAQVGSAAIAKQIRRSDKKFVAVTCHYDVLEWLQPEWVYEPVTGTLTWRSVQPRPLVEIEVRAERGSDVWPLFRRHHYMSAEHNRSSRTIVGYVKGSPAVLVSVLAMPSGTVRNAFRVHRIVTQPDYQGIGMGTRLLNAVGGAYRAQSRRLYITTSHPGLSRGLDHSPAWSMRRNASRTSRHGKELASSPISRDRLTNSFLYVGASDERLLGMLHK